MAHGSGDPRLRRAAIVWDGARTTIDNGCRSSYCCSNELGKVVGRGPYTAESYVAPRSIGYLVKRLHALSMPRIEALFDGSDLSFSQWIVLVALRDGVASTCADLARHMSHDTGATTRLVDQLEARGYVMRKRSNEDRRVIRLSLTPAGRAILRTSTPRVMQFWNDALSDFSAAEFETLIALLTRIVARIEHEGGDAGDARAANPTRKPVGR